jgi:dTDP-4-amino-4,6-dideoxygalactose transaminase
MLSREIPLFKVFMAPEAAGIVGETLQSGYIGQGPRVEEFESNLKRFFDYDFLATVNAATSAEHLAIHMLQRDGLGRSASRDTRIAGTETAWPGLSDGDEVLTTALTCTATNWPILANRLRIRWVDIDPQTLNLDLEDVERKIGPRTKIIMVVHWGGYPVDIDRLKSICERARSIHGFTPQIIEDCAHALGSKLRNRMVGTLGNLSTFSFQAIKHVTSGDGGLLMLPDAASLARAQLLRWYGIDRNSNRKDFRCEADIPEWGFKFHMNDIAAAIGNENLKHANAIIQRHRENANYFDQSLRGVAGVQLLQREVGFESSFWIYSLLVDGKSDFQRAMKERGVATSQVHERNDIHTCTREYRSFLPNLDRVVPRLSALPVGWWVTNEDREFIVDCIKRGW